MSPSLEDKPNSAFESKRSRVRRKLRTACVYGSLNVGMSRPFPQQPQTPQFAGPAIVPCPLPSSVDCSLMSNVANGQSSCEMFKLCTNGGYRQNEYSSLFSRVPNTFGPLTVDSLTANAMNNDLSASPPTVVGNERLVQAPLLSGNPSKPFRCAICDKHLASRSVYQLHLRSHSGEKPFACNLCGNAFSQKTSLTRHMRSHTGERPFPCQVCGKLFADKERIKIHMRTHTGEKPFPCEVCGKQFSQKSTVKRHMSVHTGEKPFQCDHCGKGFANRGNLTAHRRTHISSL